MLSGSCLCGAVRFSFRSKTHEIDVCHCGMCRKWSGGPSFGIESDGEPTIEGEQSVSWFESSEWGSRGFCGVCGANLFWKAPNLGFFSVMAGSVEDTKDLGLKKQIFIDRKPGYYELANKTENLTEADVFALFSDAPSQSEPKQV